MFSPPRPKSVTGASFTTPSFCTSSDFNGKKRPFISPDNDNKRNKSKDEYQGSASFDLLNECDIAEAESLTRIAMKSSAKLIEVIILNEDRIGVNAGCNWTVAEFINDIIRSENYSPGKYELVEAYDGTQLERDILIEDVDAGRPYRMVCS